MSCPGCGASGLELANAENSRTTVRMPKVDGPRRAKSHARPQAPEDAAPETSSGSRHADRTRVMAPAAPEPRRTRVEARAAAKAAEAGKGARGGSHAASGHAADEEPEPLDRRAARAERRSERRKGFGLMLTGGFAGIAVAGFVLFGVAGGGGASAPAGSTAQETVSPGSAGLNVQISASAGHSVGATSIIQMPVASASKSPSASASASASKSATATAAKTTATAGGSAGASSSPTATATSASASPTPSPSPSNTKTWCFIIC
ncbi:MAG TPA: hypothetical protein VFN97_27195 [Actinospica sp.]|nr:hypothetical protein [Actinospica sp.]